MIAGKNERVPLANNLETSPPGGLFQKLVNRGTSPMWCAPPQPSQSLNLKAPRCMWACTIAPKTSLFFQAKTTSRQKRATLCYAITLPGRKSGFQARFRPDSSREGLKCDPPAGLRPVGVPILMPSRLGSGRNPVRKSDFQSGTSA